MKKRFLYLILPIITLILEALPYGAVCVFASSPTERLRETFSYFDLTPFGYANFAPLFTAIITCLIFILLMIYCIKGIFALFFFLFIAMGAITGLSNGIPLRTNTVDNDGYNAISLSKSREAMRAFWIQMKVNEQLTKGLRVKDMPDEWFEVPSDEAMKNSMVATIGVYAANRLMDQHRFDEAEALMNHMLEIESGIVALHRNLIICDLVYLELIGQNRSDKLEILYSKELKKFIKTMKTFPSVIRTEYAYSLLKEHNPESAAKSMAAFERIAATYPYPNDINSERELIQLVDDKVSV